MVDMCAVFCCCTRIAQKQNQIKKISSSSKQQKKCNKNKLRFVFGILIDIHSTRKYVYASRSTAVTNFYVLPIKGKKAK